MSNKQSTNRGIKYEISFRNDLTEDGRLFYDIVIDYIRRKTGTGWLDARRMFFNNGFDIEKTVEDLKQPHLVILKYENEDTKI